MEQANDYVAAGQAILDFQLAMMRGAMAVAGHGAQRMLELGMAAAAATPSPSPNGAGTLGGSHASRQALAKTAALASATTKHEPAFGSRFADLRFATSSQLASANREYVERMQENVDSMLHALAMAPVAADRFIRATVAASERPTSNTGAAAPPRRRSAPARKAARPRRADHAR